jgi:hypothetical protein
MGTAVSVYLMVGLLLAVALAAADVAGPGWYHALAMLVLRLPICLIAWPLVFAAIVIGVYRTR